MKKASKGAIVPVAKRKLNGTFKSQRKKISVDLSSLSTEDYQALVVTLRKSVERRQSFSILSLIFLQI